MFSDPEISRRGTCHSPLPTSASGNLPNMLRQQILCIMTFQSGSGHLRYILFIAKSKVGANRSHFVWRLRQLRPESLPATKGVFHSTEKSANFQWNQMEQKFPGIKSRNFRYRPREVVLKFRKIGNPENLVLFYSTIPTRVQLHCLSASYLFLRPG